MNRWAIFGRPSGTKRDRAIHLASLAATLPAEAPEADIAPDPEAEAAVEAGRKAFGGWSGYPWYDSQSDTVRRIDVSPPPAPKPRATSTTSSAGQGLDLAFHIAAWTLVGLLLGLVVWLLWRYFREGDSEPLAAANRAADKARIESLPFPVRPGKRDLLDEVRRLYDAGDYSQAIIYLYSYQLVQLDRQQIIRLAKGKTNRQYVREVPAGTRLQRLLEDTMVAFEDVFFGQRALERGRFELCWSRVDEFQSLVAALTPRAT